MVRYVNILSNSPLLILYENAIDIFFVLATILPMPTLHIKPMMTLSSMATRPTTYTLIIKPITLPAG
ncbi:uncharacterized protein K441DRAFT_667445 [Cenococcum geophilum 1.58]|uniref:uncharacterized protein n=1 Tax=Cenococcum geophilum 1.58 TaxID=794803 RepID=UPI00358E1CBE|nr:hypothetical protein K441DRAFT_667445 [Cenococcum geophilum 1.58]